MWLHFSGSFNLCHIQCCIDFPMNKASPRCSFFSSLLLLYCSFVRFHSSSYLFLVYSILCFRFLHFNLFLVFFPFFMFSCCGSFSIFLFQFYIPYYSLCMLSFIFFVLRLFWYSNSLFAWFLWKILLLYRLLYSCSYFIHIQNIRLFFRCFILVGFEFGMCESLFFCLFILMLIFCKALTASKAL